MVLPLFDDNRDRRITPYVNYAIIAINILVFVVLQDMGNPSNRFTYSWSTVPEEIVTGRDVETEDRKIRHPVTGQVLEVPGLGPTRIAGFPEWFGVYFTLFTSMFMHGGLGHILGNMWFLWIFGDNIEDFLGHARYIVFYFVCGVLASLCHIVTTYAIGANPSVPSLGASGAISGVLGGYVLLYPQKPVTVILFRFLTQVPAFMAIGIWFLFQLINGLGTLGDPQGGGVAYGAHIGGFIFGLALVKIFAVGLVPEHYPRPPSRMYPL